VASSINLILAQRLARRVCRTAQRKCPLVRKCWWESEFLRRRPSILWCVQGKGCNKCAGTGYKGRIALYEVMPMTEELREFVLNGASAAEIRREAVRRGMMTLRQSGLLRLKEGVTSLEEVLRVTAAD